ncbi:MAG TPA: dihydrofolate reductase [Pyrinomonadaceae bacterium]|nr:dihydrofolate reductase [Pyrinomonadaceae bacterium]
MCPILKAYVSQIKKTKDTNVWPTFMIIGIVAVDQNGAIGKGGKLPWHYSADMKFFKETTTGHACVMGYKTWLTLKRPLPNRLNIVLSRQSEIEAQESVVVMRSVESVLNLAKDSERDLFVIGGEQVYRAFLAHIDRWLVTEVPLTIDGADTFVPADYLDGFTSIGVQQLEENLIVRTYERTPSSSRT